MNDFEQNADVMIQGLLPEKFTGASIELAAYLKGLLLKIWFAFIILPYHWSTPYTEGSLFSRFIHPNAT